MNGDDHQGLIKVLNNGLDSVVLVAFGNRSVISTHPVGMPLKSFPPRHHSVWKLLLDLAFT